MTKSHQHGDSHGQRQAAADRKALRRVEKARAKYTKSEGRVAALRARLTRAEERLVRRTARLAKAEDALVALAATRASSGADETTAANMAPGTPEGAADELAMIAAQSEPLTPVAVADGLKPAAASAGNGAAPRRSRSRARRSPATEDEAPS